MEQADRGELSNCTFHTARTLITHQRAEAPNGSYLQNRSTHRLQRVAGSGGNAHQQTRATAAILGEPEMEPGPLMRGLTYSRRLFRHAVSADVTQINPMRLLSFAGVT